jgi:hypothetical protein
MSNRIIYTHRRNVFEAEKTIAIDGNDLSLKEGAASEMRVPLSAVERVRIGFEPTRVQNTLYTCRVWVKGHSGVWVTLHSQSYKGFADFEAHDAQYRTFVESLNNAVAAANPKAKFEAGSAVWVYALNIGCLGIAALALAWVLVLTGGEGWSEITIWKAFIVLGMIPLAVAWVGANWPRRYDPRAIPQNLIPSATD